MYRPWIPLDGMPVAGAPPFPQLSWSVQGCRSVVIRWEETFASARPFEIAFDDGLAGLVAIDESTYASVRGYGLPGPCPGS